MATQFPLTTAFRAEDLPDAQRLALEALLQGMSQPEAAQHARTSERTLRRWQRDPRFIAALRQARCDAWIETTTAIQRLNRNALEALQRVLDSDSPRAQVYAAKTVLLLTVKALDVEAMCGRIAQAEADLEAHLNGGTKPTFFSDPEDENGNEDPGNTSDPTVPAPAGTPQGNGSGGIHPVAGRALISSHTNPSQSSGPATGQLPSRRLYTSAHEGDRHAPGNHGARDDPRHPDSTGRGESTAPASPNAQSPTPNAHSGQIRPKPDIQARRRPQSHTLAARHLATWAAASNPEAVTQRPPAPPTERRRYCSPSPTYASRTAAALAASGGNL